MANALRARIVAVLMGLAAVPAHFALPALPALFALPALPALSARAALAAAPATRPVVPPLVVGGDEPKSFVVEGIVRSTPAAGMGFYVATDGRRQVSALYDAADGTPLFLSDGQQTLVYDLANGRIVRVPTSRGYVRVEWNAGEPKPLSFSFGAGFRSNPEKLKELNGRFRIDRFVAASAGSLKRLESAADVEWFAAERPSGDIDAVEIRAGGAGGASAGFRFTSLAKDQGFYRLELEATHIGAPVPAERLAFPDIKQLGKEIAFLDLERRMLPTFLVFFQDGRAWMAKMALAVGPGMQKDAETILPNADWPELRRRDVALGGRYRKALAQQGVKLRLYPPATATQPTR